MSILGAPRGDRSTIDDFLDLARDHPDRVAVRSYGLEGKPATISYGELAGVVDSVATHLVQLGVRAGDPVSFQLPNWWEFAAVHLACARIGAVANPILPILREREVRFILDRLRSSVFIVPSSFRGFDHSRLAHELRDELTTLHHVVVVRGESGTDLTFDDVARTEVGDTERTTLDKMRPAGSSLAQIMFTSGTTGEPKGVMHTHDTIFMGVKCVPEVLELGADDVVLMFSPLAHQTGYYYGVAMPFLYGIPVVYLDEWSAVRALELIEVEGVTWTMGTTTFVMDMCEAAKGLSVDTSSLRYFVCGGAPIPSHAVELARDALHTSLVAVWGMTELGIATMTQPSDSLQRVSSTDGLPLAWVSLRIADADGRDLPVGEVGRLLCRSEAQHIGYFDRPDLYLASFGDGWFDTGDLARADDHGYIRIAGRVKDLIIRGGENIPAVEVENLLRTEPSVKDVAVVGVPDDRLGERICAVVVPAEGADVDLAVLQAHLHGYGMAKQYWPERLLVRDDLPRTSTGKVQKFEVRTWAIERLSVAT